MYAYTVLTMVDLILNRRLNTRNILLVQGTRGEHVGYLLPNGGSRFVPWLGFLERAKARAMKAARPVRLVDITRVGRANGHAPEWQDLPADSFAREHLSPFVNFHRPSLYATEYLDPKGKVRRKYLREDVKTPYEKLKSLPRADGHLKPGVTFEALDRIAFARSDLQAARALNAARTDLFRRIHSAAAA